ncbi:MAG: ABC transporter substrate-binding protein, partial [Deltaproteobacteria bacterium]|nr:ABC transporter substrate-binding protein [Deltaproteobacteria bacterium]
MLCRLSPAKLLSLLSLSLCLALFAAACGGDDDSAPAAAPDAPAAVTEPADAMPAAPVLEGASAAPVVQPTIAPVMAPVETKIDRVVFGMSPVSEEYSNPMRLGPPNNIQLNPMYEYLIGMDPQSGAWTPELATRWEVEPDGKNIRFFLQEGVPFQDGWGEMTAKDVKLTFEELAHPEAGHGNSGYMRTALKGVEIINDHELVLDVNEPDAGLLWVISRQEQSILVISKDAYDDLGHSPTLQDEPIPGTGPYQFKERREGEYIRFERIEEPHWRFTPDFPELELRWMSEA